MQNNSIAVINTGNWGSTGKIAKNLCCNFRQEGYRVLFCHGHGDVEDNNNEYKISSSTDRLIHSIGSRLFGNQGCYSHFSTRKLIKKLERERVDTVILLSLHGNYLNQNIFFDYLSSHNINVIYIMIDEYPYVGKCGGTMGCTNYVNGCKKCPHVKMYPPSLIFDRASSLYEMKARNYKKTNKIVFVGPEFVVDNAKRSPMMNGHRFCVLDETIDVSTYAPREYDSLKNKLMISEDKIVIVCVASITSGYKGARYFTELASKFEDDRRFVFVHVASEKEGIERPTNNLIVRGFVESEQELAEYMSMADLFVFPSVQDTMSNTCIEALACGSPLLCFNISGMPYLGNEEVMTLVEARNVEQMVTVVKHTKKKTVEMINKCRRYALSRYDSRDYCKRIMSILNNM